MIPKKIHYCWFGGNPLPELAEKCIASWREVLPEYEIIRWDESTFDINSNIYVKEAYQAKKFAFVSDYVRLYAMYNHGGIYMDTDVEVLKSLDQFLEHEAFSGFESYTAIPTGIMASEKGFKGFEELLNYYTDKHFINKDGTYDMTTNVEIITDYYSKKGFVANNKLQTIEGFTLYPKITFCPRQIDFENGRLDEMYTIHYFAGSWLTEEEKAKRNSLVFKLHLNAKLIIRKIITNIIGEQVFHNIRGRKNIDL